MRRRVVAIDQGEIVRDERGGGFEESPGPAGSDASSPTGPDQPYSSNAADHHLGHPES